MRRYASPIKFGIEVGKVGWRGVAELFIHSDFFKFEEKRVGLAQIMRVAQLADQIGRANELSLFAIGISGAWRRRKTRKLDSVCNPVGIECFKRTEAIHHEELRAIDVIGQQCGVRGASRQLRLIAGGINNVPVLVVTLQNSTNVTNVVKKTGNDNVREIADIRFSQESSSPQNVVGDES